MKNETITHAVIGCAIEVHRNLGPGLLESAYEKYLYYELQQKGFDVKSQVSLPIKYKNNVVDSGYRIDLLLPNSLIIELKSVDKLSSIYSAQVLTYMKLSNIKTGLLINFNSKKLIDGVRRLYLP